MKQFLTTSYALAFTAICCLFASCEGGTKTVEHETQPVIEITVLDTSNPDRVTVQFKANSTTNRYIYAIGTMEDKESFLDGTIPGKELVSGNETTKFTFEDLDADTKYIVYAMGFNSANDKGPLAAVSAGTYTDTFMASLSYVSDISAGIQFICSDDFNRCKYFLGTAEDKEKFLNDDDSLDIKFNSEIFNWSENYFDLDPNTDYVFYAVGYYRNDMETKLFELPFKTATLGSNDIPNVTLEIGEKDFFTQTYIVTPNDKCKKIVMFHKRTRDYEDMIYNKDFFAGNIMEMLYEFQGRDPERAAEQNKVYIAVNEPLRAQTQIPEFDLDESLDIYIQIYNELYEPVSVKKYNTKTPSLNENLAIAKASDFEVKINNVNPDTQTINFSVKYKGQDCSAYLFDILDKDWVDGELAKPNNPYAVHEKLYAGLMIAGSKTGFVYKMNDFSTATTDKDLKPNKTYYLGICPMNANGPRKFGWGELVVVPFNTNK